MAAGSEIQRGARTYTIVERVVGKVTMYGVNWSERERGRHGVIGGFYTTREAAEAVIEPAEVAPLEAP